MKQDLEVQYIIVDLFAGFGGTTLGFDRFRYGRKKVFRTIVAINHDAKAIESHWMNHKNVKHFEEDIRTVGMDKLQAVVTRYRKMYPNAKLILWASLECTNFSKAKGGMPRDADSRTLGYSLYKLWDPATKKYYDGESYIQTLKPDLIMIENVVEFMAWGPMRIKAAKKHKDRTDLKFIINRKTGKEEYAWEPISRKNGIDWLNWRKDICKFGYVDDWKQLNAANYGAHTSRNRLFGIFAPSKELIKWPKPTHAKNPDSGMFERLKKWQPVKHCLDFEDEGQSIFDRKEPLVENTEKRIYAGLLKFVADGKEDFLLKYNSTSKNGKHVPPGIDEPSPAIACQDRLGKVHAVFLNNYNHSSKANSIEKPCPTLVTKDKLAMVSCKSFLQHYYGNGYCTGTEETCPTIRTKDGISFVTSYYSGGGQVNGMDDPSPSLTTVPKQRICKTVFLDQQYGNSKPATVENPCGTITSNPKYAICSAKPWLMNTNYNNVGSSIDEPCGSLVASRRHRYLLNPQYQNKGADVENPCFTLIARMDKIPPYLVTAESGEFGVVIYDTDTETMVKIKKLMAAYNLIDIKMRMLKVPELLKIQGFPETYKGVGGDTAMKKFIGNAVVPEVVTAMAGAILDARIVFELTFKPAAKAA